MLIEDWKTLAKGDKIQVFSNDHFLGKSGVAVNIGHSGKYTVMEVQDNGLILLGNHGYCFQDMIKSGVSEAGFNVEPPKLIMVKQK